MNIGNKIKRLRLQNNLTQEELAFRCDLSKGFISLVERDLTSPSISTLVDILDTLGTNLKEFFSEYDNEKIVYKQEDVFTKENVESGHSITWLISNAQKNEMEPILATIQPKGILFNDESHFGEEFGYVINGKIALEIGNKKYVVKKGESFCYKSNNLHKIYNPYSKEAVVLMVSTPPSF